MLESSTFNSLIHQKQQKYISKFGLREALDSTQWRRCFDLSDLTEKTDPNGETVAHTSTYNGSPAWFYLECRF